MDCVAYACDVYETTVVFNLQVETPLFKMNSFQITNLICQYVLHHVKCAFIQ